MKKIDWSRHVPLGMDANRVKAWLGAAVGGGIGWSLQFFVHLSNALGQLYDYRNNRRILVPSRSMAYYGDVLHSSLTLLPIAAASMLFVAVIFYAHHYQSSRSIYTMRRLPNRWELWRRVLTMPALTAACCLLAAGLLLALYYGIYLWTTPEQCLLPGQWQHLWEG